MVNPQNILQFEFFHVGGPEIDSIDDLYSQCAERASDGLQLAMHGHESGTGIKTVIRIYDMEGKITVLANRIKKLEEQSDELFLMSRRSFIHSSFIGWRIEVIYHRLEKLQRKLSLYAVDYLSRALNEPLSVAVDRVYYHFREVKRDELLELAQAAKVAKNFWLFIFEPNNILADKNKNIISVI